MSVGESLSAPIVASFHDELSLSSELQEKSSSPRSSSIATWRNAFTPTGVWLLVFLIFGITMGRFTSRIESFFSVFYENGPSSMQKEIDPVWKNIFGSKSSCFGTFLPELYVWLWRIWVFHLLYFHAKKEWGVLMLKQVKVYISLFRNL